MGGQFPFQPLLIYPQTKFAESQMLKMRGKTHNHLVCDICKICGLARLRVFLLLTAEPP